MKKITFKLTILILFAGFTNAQVKNSDVSMFPKAKQGYKQWIIDLKKSGFEEKLKIEFYVGKVQVVDKCNSFFLAGNLKEIELQGWGYSYYEFTTKGDVAGTQMGCADNTKIKKFIKGESIMARYNSRLPIVVYLPEGYELRYKLWSASENEWLGTPSK
jgi:ecotin